MGESIGVGIIVYDEKKTIGDCIESIAPFVDKVVVVGQNDTSDETISAIKKAYEKTEYYNFGEWGDDFAAKRNYSFSFLDTDWLYWIDADDTVYQGENIRKLIAEADAETGAIWHPYHYAIDEFGNPFTIYERERLLRRKFGWVWKGRLHETVSPLAQCKFVRTLDLINMHHHLEGGSRSDRNFRILNIMLKEDPNDKRVWLYLGHQEFASGNWTKAIEWYMKFGTDEGAVSLERYQALCYCSRAMRNLADPQAVDIAMMAIQLHPQFKDGYLELAHSYLMLQDFDRAIHWALLSDTKSLITDLPALVFVNPLDYSFNKFCLLGDAYLRKNKYQDAQHYFLEAYQVRPVQDVAQRLNQLRDIDIRQHVADSIKMLAMHLLDNRETNKLISLRDSVPYWFKELPDYKQFKTSVEHYTSGIKDEAQIVKNPDNAIVVDVSNIKNVRENLKKLDRRYAHIIAMCPTLRQNKEQSNMLSTVDWEEIVTSEKGRHIINLRSEPERTWLEYDKKIPKHLAIKFYLGQGLERWNPETIKNIGCGGSETATAYIAKALAQKDCRSLIYAMDNQVWDSVIYRNYTEYQPDGAGCHLFVSSRVPELFDNDIQAKQKWLWFHDIHRWDRLTPERASQIDALILLSQWHVNFIKATYPFLKEAPVIDMDNNPLTYSDCETQGVWYADAVCPKLPKLVIIGNGLDTERFHDISEERIPHRFIWCSSADRGLEEVLTMWPLIRQALPDAELKIFYGWEYYDNYLHIPQMKEYKQKILKLVEQDGVEWCGRVGQRRLAHELMKADIMLYPPHPFRETYGIAFLEAQAAGVLCFYRQNGALGETIGGRGIPIPLDTKPDGIVRLIVDTLSQKETCATIRVRGREYAMGRDWCVQADKFLKLYEVIENGQNYSHKGDSPQSS